MATAVATRAVAAPARAVVQDECDEAARRSQFINQLYTDHRSALLLHVLGRNGGDFQRAEDVVQETMLRAWLHADGISQQKGSVCGWLMRVARNVVIDAHRARSARPPEVSADSAAGQTTIDHADRVVTLIAVRRALARLSPIHREVLVQAYYHGRNQQESAVALGIPVGTVKSRMYYALSALRHALTTDVC